LIHVPMIQRFLLLPTERRVSVSVASIHSIKKNPSKRHAIIEANVNAGFFKW
jgi:hypothetical protein